MKAFKAGKPVNQGHYKSFQRNPIHKEWQGDDMEVLPFQSFNLGKS